MEKTIEQQLEELIPEREFIISTDVTGRGKLIYPELPANENIFSETVLVNSRTVKVDRLYDLHDEFGPDWTTELWKLAVDRKADEIYKHLQQKWEKEVDETGYETWKSPATNEIYNMNDLWEMSHQWAVAELRKKGYSVPEYIDY